MCRLLGIIANKPVDVEFSLERLRRLAYENPDGWGIGWYEDGEARIFKQGIPAIAYESKLPSLSKEVRSKVIIAHVRKGTEGGPSEQNSHPFKYENWIFAHNGSVDRDNLLSILVDKYKEKIEGETDSEVYFYWILQCIEEEGDIIKGIEKAVAEVVGKSYKGLNFLLSNGSTLFAFRYSDPSQKARYTLYKLERNPSKHEPIEFLSKETIALIRSKSLKGEKAVLICSEKLTKEKGTEIGFGNILIVRPDLSIEEVKIL